MVIQLIDVFLLFKHFRRSIMWLNRLTYLFAWWILNAFKAFEFKITNITFFFNSNDILVVDLLMSTSCTFTHDHSLLHVFNSNSNDCLLEILVSAIVIFVFIFIFHLLSLVFNIVTLGLSNVFVFTSFRLLGGCAMSSANSMGASLRFNHTSADLVWKLLICALLRLLTFECCIVTFALLLFVVLFEVSVVTSHRNMRNIWNSLI